MEIKEVIIRIMEARIRDDMRPIFISLISQASMQGDNAFRDKVIKKALEEIDEFEKGLN